MPDGSLDVASAPAMAASMSAARRASLIKLLHSIDLDGNGVIDRSEFDLATKSAMFKRFFKVIDAQIKEDGQISLEEWLKGMALLGSDMSDAEYEKQLASMLRDVHRVQGRTFGSAFLGCFTSALQDLRKPNCVGAWYSMYLSVPSAAVGGRRSSGGGGGAKASIRTPVVFVLGGPGAGKGTQCDQLCAAYPECRYFAAGDLLRNEVVAGSTRGKEIAQLMKEGKLVPARMTIALLTDAIAKAEAAGAKGPFLADGFPRAMDQLTAWDAGAPACAAVLLFEASEEAMTTRLLERGKTSGRTDDNPDSIKRRFATYTEQALPVVAHLERTRPGLVKRIDASKPVAAVASAARIAVDEVMSLAA